MQKPDSALHPMLVMCGMAGPFAGVRLGAIVAYDFALDDTFTPRPGLTRWQRFLDRHLHDTRWPTAAWADFPPAAIAPLRALPSPFART